MTKSLVPFEGDRLGIADGLVCAVLGIPVSRAAFPHLTSYPSPMASTWVLGVVGVAASLVFIVRVGWHDR